MDESKSDKAKKSKWTAPAEPLTDTRLHALIDAYGGDPRRWPDAEREAALARLATSVEARAACVEAQGLDAVLDRLTAPAPSADLVKRARALMPRRRRTGSGHRRVALFARRSGADTGNVALEARLRPAMMAASMAMIFAIGVGVGWAAGHQPQGVAGDSLALSLAGGGSDRVRVSGPDLSASGGPDLVVALH